MKTIINTSTQLTIILLSCMTLLNCTDKNSGSQENSSASSEGQIFPKEEAGPATNFTGKAYNFGLVSNDSVYNTLVGNVYFEAGARSNWHTHAGGQILIITDGVGYHQIEGQPRQTMKKGDVAKCPPNVRHWHGASEDRSLSQLYILPNTEKGIVNWMEPVTDQQYKSTN